MTRLRVTLNNQVYNVVVEEIDSEPPPPAPRVPTAAAPLETAALSLGPAPHVLVAAEKLSSDTADRSGMILSPLAGKVVSIDVRVGDPVAEGAQVATIEAMKMNTYVFASKAGTVVTVDAQIGDAVEEGATLLCIG
jgi:biotin carboxyl carrier protein